MRTVFHTLHTIEDDGTILEDIVDVAKKSILFEHELKLDFSQPEQRFDNLTLRSTFVDESPKIEEGTKYFGIEIAKPGDRVEVTKITGRETPNKGVQVATQILHGLRLGAQSSFPDKPVFIDNLVTSVNVRDGDLSVTDKVSNIQTINDLTNILLAKGRELPTVYVARKEQGRLPNQNAVTLLANKLGGLAHVAVEESAAIGRKIRENIDPSLICEPGFIRVYWPNSDTEFFWNALNKEKSAQIYEHIVDQLTGKLISEDFRFERIRTYAVANGAHDEELDTIYEAALCEQKGIADEATTRLYESEGKVQSLERELRGYREPTKNLHNLVTTIETLYSDSLVVHPRVHTQIKKSPFRHVEKARDALVWLATQYHDLCSQPGFTKEQMATYCAQATDFNFCFSQSKQSMREFKDDYSVILGGERIWLDHHLRYGSNSNPVNVLRIGLSYLPKEDKVLVGFVDCHQRTVT